MHLCRPCAHFMHEILYALWSYYTCLLYTFMLTLWSHYADHVYVIIQDMRTHCACKECRLCAYIVQARNAGPLGWQTGTTYWTCQFFLYFNVEKGKGLDLYPLICLSRSACTRINIQFCIFRLKKCSA